jgi:hypothetical protein
MVNFGDGAVQYKILSSWTIKQREDCGIIQEKRTTEAFNPDGTVRSNTGTTVYGNNSKYAFVLTAKEEKDNWLLKELVFDPKAPIAKAQRRVEQDINSLISRHYLFLDHGTLASVVAANELGVTGIPRQCREATRLG